MSPEELVRALRVAVVEENTSLLRSELDAANNNEDQAGDAYEKAVARLWRSLDQTQRDDLLRLVRQATIDAVSHVLGLLDGTSSLKGFPGIPEFILTDRARPGVNLAGDLQDEFLRQYEEEEEEAEGR